MVKLEENYRSTATILEAANAQIGVARAAFFPTLTLGGTLGYQNTRLAELVNTSKRFWSLGPTLAMTLFDAGARSAQQAQAAAARSTRGNVRVVATAPAAVTERRSAARRVMGRDMGELEKGRSGKQDQGARTKDQGARSKGEGARTKDQGRRSKGEGARTKGEGGGTINR
mgnify:CR=1 FL=1